MALHSEVFHTEAGVKAGAKAQIEIQRWHGKVRNESAAKEGFGNVWQRVKGDRG